MQRNITVALALFALVLTGIAVPVATATDNAKYFVCKYVGTPGVDERLQTGNNPIDIGGGQLPTPVAVGTYFSDSQGRSYILAEDVGQPDPDVNLCPPPDGPPEPTPTPTPAPTATPTPEPTATPTPAPTATPTPEPTATPTSEPTATPTPAPTATPTAPPVASQFSAEPAECKLDDPQSRIIIRRIAGVLLLRNLDLVIDGDVITADDIVFDDETNEATINVAPGEHDWAVVDPLSGDTLASGTVDCPECFAAVPTPTPTIAPTPTPVPPTVTPTHTLPPTDTVSEQTQSQSSGLAAILLLMLALTTTVVVVAKRR